MFKGCKTAAVVEQYAQAVCSRNGWDAGLITPHMHQSEDLVNPLSQRRMWHFPDLRNQEWVWMKLTHILYLGKDG
jgi:hypothetical protein